MIVPCAFFVGGVLSYFIIYFFIFREGGRKGEREGEKHGVGGREGRNCGPFALQDNTQPAEPLQSGLHKHLTRMCVLLF